MRCGMSSVFRAAVAITVLFPISGMSADWVGVVPFRSQTETRIFHWNGKFMLLTRSLGEAFTSEDGRTWTNTKGSKSPDRPSNVDRYVPIGGMLYALTTNDLQRSTDAIHWTRVPEPPGCGLTDLTTGNGMVVGVSGCPEREIWISSDGDRWTSRKYPNSFGLDRIAYGNGFYVALNEHEIASSTNAVDWTIRHSEPNATYVYGLKDLLFAKGRFVAVGENGRILTSTDGTAWSAAAIEEKRTYFQTLVFQGERFIAQTSNSKELYTSPDGLQWERQFSNGFPVSGIAYSKGRFLVTDGKGNLAESDDSLKAWTEYPAPSGYLNALLHTGKEYIVLGNGGMLATSPDAIHWTERPADTLRDIAAAAWGAGTVVAVGRQGLIRTSTDGVEWVTRTSGSKDSLLSVTFGNDVFVVTSYQGRILTSSDGAEWTTTYTPTKLTPMREVAFGNGLFMALYPEANSLLTSPDGRQWTLRKLANPNGIFQNYLTFGNSRFLMGYGTIPRLRDTVWTTADGISVQPHQVEPFYSWNHYFARSMTFGNGYFLALHWDGTKILSSVDGSGAWTADSSNYASANLVAYAGGRLFKVGSYSISSAADYKPSALSRMPTRFAAMRRAQRIPPEGILLPSAWAAGGLVAEVHDTKGNLILRRPMSSMDGDFRFLPPFPEGAYYLNVMRSQSRQ